MNRRDFLRNSVTGGTTFYFVSNSNTHNASLETITPVVEECISAPAHLKEEVYQVEVPGTLDLAERARLAINALTSAFDPEKLEIFDTKYFNSQPPYMTHLMFGRLCVLQPKYLEALPMMRVMTNSRQNFEIDSKAMHFTTSLIEDDGIFWVHPSPQRPWHGADMSYADVYGQARMARALIIWHQYDDDTKWKKLMDKMVEGHNRMAVHKRDYAYFPSHGGVTDAPYIGNAYLRSEWRSTEEPRNERDSFEERSVFLAQGIFPGPLANWYRLTGNKKALQLSKQFVNFLTKPNLWGVQEEPPGIVGAEHAHHDGHFYGRMETLRALLEYAVVADNEYLKSFVRDGYEWSRNYGIPRLGYFSDQACAPPRIIALAIKLSDAGVGDYWEDVDQYIRNQGTEDQILDEGYLEAMSQSSAERTPRPLWDNTADTVKKAIGDWGNHCWPVFMAGCPTPPKTERAGFFCHGCCSSHASMGLYYAWEAIVRYEQGTAQVNLLLNRASPWLDIDSYLPYEGKVVIRNKAAKKLRIRIPRWVDKRAVNCQVGPNSAGPTWFNNYLVFDGLRPTDIIIVRFPVVESTEKYTLYGQEYICRFRGNTLVDIAPRTAPPIAHELGTPVYPLNQRQNLDGINAPSMKVTRYVSERVLYY